MAGMATAAYTRVSRRHTSEIFSFTLDTRSNQSKISFKFTQRVFRSPTYGSVEHGVVCLVRFVQEEAESVERSPSYSVEKWNDSIGVYLSFGNGSCLTFHIHVFTKHKSCSGTAWIVASIFFTV